MALGHYFKGKYPSIPLVLLEFFIDMILPAALWSWVRLSLQQGYLLRVEVDRRIGLTNLPLLCSDCLEIWEPRTPETPRTCPEIAVHYHIILRYVHLIPPNFFHTICGLHYLSAKSSAVPELTHFNIPLLYTSTQKT
jgi:hypothetical protein